MNGFTDSWHQNWGNYPDNLFTLTTSAVLGCGLAPVVMVNDKVFGHIMLRISWHH